MSVAVPRPLAGRLTVTIPEAGELLGIGRGAAYRAAAAGELPTLTLGRRKVVPVPKLLQLVGITPEDTEAGPSTGPATANVSAPAKEQDSSHGAPPAA